MRKGLLAVVGHIGPAARGDKMSAPHALAALAALGQPTRLAIFQLLQLDRLMLRPDKTPPPPRAIR